MGTVFIGGATFLWYVALGPAVASRPGFDLPDLVVFAYPIGDLLLLFGVLSLLWRDLAMYEAKRAGGGCWRRFEDTEHAAAAPSPGPALPTA